MQQNAINQNQAIGPQRLNISNTLSIQIQEPTEPTLSYQELGTNVRIDHQGSSFNINANVNNFTCSYTGPRTQIIADVNCANVCCTIF